VTTSPILLNMLVNNILMLGYIRRQCFLVTHLAYFQLNFRIAQLPLFSDGLFLKSIVDMLSRFDLDLQNKVRLELLPVPIILNMLVTII
jgi:hsp70-interacting protein